MENIIKAWILLCAFVVSVNTLGTFQSYNNEKGIRLQDNLNNDGVQTATNAKKPDSEDKANFISHVNQVKESYNYHHHHKQKSLKYEPTWNSLDSRPLPRWYDQSKVGIFIHWGVFSVPGFKSAWFWKFWKDGDNDIGMFMKGNFKPGTTYQDFARDFTAEFYNPEEWADLFKMSGAKYVVLTSKHHEGYTLWPSRYSFSWNAKDIGPNRDLVGDLANAIRNRTDLKFGLYHSLFEFYNPLFLNDENNNLTTDEFVRFKTLPELYELVDKYRPEVVWSDGEWSGSSTYWKTKKFLAWLYNESPVKQTVVTNDRWGSDTMCKHGGYYTCADRYNPGVLQPHKWENCFTLDKKAWVHRRNANISDYLTPEELITIIVESVSCGGNVLVNVGPTKDGMIENIQQERLLQMGEWLRINGEAIYDTVPWKAQNDTTAPGVWYTANKNTRKIYATLTKWPGSSVTLASISVNDFTDGVQMLGASGPLEWMETEEGILINLPRSDEIKSKWAWSLVFI